MYAAAAAAKSLQLCPTLSDPMDCSPPGSSGHGTFQARVLEWGAIAFSRQCVGVKQRLRREWKSFRPDIYRMTLDSLGQKRKGMDISY